MNKLPEMRPEDDLPIDEVSGVEERPQNRREWGGPLRSLLLPLLIVATIVGVLFYVERLRSDTVTTVEGLGIVALPEGLNTTNSSPATEVGRTPPDFVLETPDGERLRFSDLRGQAVLVNFWATWCAPCRQEMPEIVRAYNERRDEGLVVVAINLQENAQQVRQFADDFGMTFPTVIDRTGQVADAWRIGGPIEGIPATYFVDADGIVQARTFGQLTAAALDEGLEKILPAEVAHGER